MYDAQYGKMYKCSCCGYKFWVTHREDWVYKREKKMFCTYTCFRKDQKEYEKNHRPKRQYSKRLK